MRCVNEIGNISFWCRLQTQLTISCNRIIHKDNGIWEFTIIQHLEEKRKLQSNHQKAFQPKFCEWEIHVCNRWVLAFSLSRRKRDVFERRGEDMEMLWRYSLRLWSTCFERYSGGIKSEIKYSKHTQTATHKFMILFLWSSYWNRCEKFA